MVATSAELDETEEVIISFIREQPGRFAGTPEVADELDLTTNGASYRLKQLRKRGLLDSRQPSRDEIWFLPGYRDAGVGEHPAGPAPGDGGGGRRPEQEVDTEGDDSELPLQKQAKTVATVLVTPTLLAVLLPIVLAVKFSKAVPSDPLASVRNDMSSLGGVFGAIRRLHSPAAATPIERLARRGVWAYLIGFSTVGMWAIWSITNSVAVEVVMLTSFCATLLAVGFTITSLLAVGAESDVTTMNGVEN